MTGPARPPFAHLSKDGWLFTKYDDFDRVVMTGFIALPSSQTITTEIRKEKQDERNAQTSNFNETRLASGTTPAATPGAANNPIHSYSNLSLPTSGYYVLSINYYDDYSYTGAPTVPQTVGDGEVVFFNNTEKPKGLPTGKWTRVLANTTTQASAKKELSYTFYDYKSRPIRTYVTNNLSTTSYIQTDVKYDFEGKILETITRHKPSSDVAEITIRDYFTYSEQGRLLTHSNKVNNNSIQLLADNTYNELGQLIGKKVGNTVGSTPLQEVDYYYNIRGWLKSINDIAELGTDLFAFKLNYNEVENETNYEGKALYNGNIAETYWRTGKDDVKRKYGYFYDDLNRLTNAVYQRPNSSGIGVVTNAYNESLTYDKNGNIISLQRNGDIEEIAPALEIDDLDYVYRANTNELIKVTDNLTTSPSGFNDRANNAEEYGYDAHGNMTRDDNKGITEIKYNHLNLPIKITFGTQGEIAYVYNAEGKKLEKTVTQTGSTAVTTKYLDGFQYVDNVLQFFPHAEGYVKKNGNNYNYVFNYTDHLGNVRLSYSDLDKDGVLEQEERVVTVATDGSGNATEFFVSCIVEENNYYPFGLKHSGYNEGGFEASKYKYKYNGKELQDELGLNVYDYGARFYDPAIGRWMNVDPLAEKHPDYSPYVYCANNPVLYVDPDGRDWVISQSVRPDGTTVMQISITGKLINQSSTVYTAEQMSDYSTRLSGAIKSSFESASGGQLVVNVTANISVASVDNPLASTDHAFTIVDNGKLPDSQNPGGFRPSGVIGHASFGELGVYINENVLSGTPATSGTNAGTGKTATNGPTLERTGPHELGHTGTLEHPTVGTMNGNLMHQTSQPNAGTNVTQNQIMQLQEAYNRGELNQGRQFYNTAGNIGPRKPDGTF
jgi:RHS repeat-associated protein